MHKLCNPIVCLVIIVDQECFQINFFFFFLFSWIINYHEHETLLQENEDERLSKEEQDLAWEVYRKTLEWEEVRRVSPDENTPESAQDQQQQPVMEPAVDPVPDPPPEPAPKVDGALERARQRHAYKYGYGLRRCTNLAHILTMRTQHIKAGGFAICGECARMLRWEDLEPDPRCY